MASTRRRSASSSTHAAMAWASADSDLRSSSRTVSRRTSTSKGRASSRYRAPNTSSTSLDERSGQELFELRQDGEQIAHEAVVGDFEDGCFAVLVDCDDGARILDAREVLDCARDADGDVEVRRNDFAGLAHLHVVRGVAGVDGGS